MRKTRYKFVTFLTVVTLFLNLFLTSAGAWYGPYFIPNGNAGDVHERDTEEWAIECGMNSSWAEEVAESNALVDILFKKDLRWHLDRSYFTGDTEDTRIKQSKNELILAKRKIDAAAYYQQKIKITSSTWRKWSYYYKLMDAKEDAVMYLGRSIHPIQDLYAHMDAGKYQTEEELDGGHGMLNAEPVDVTILYPDGSSYVKQMKVEEKDSNGFVYSMFDDVYYDYDEGWIFRTSKNKEENKRWQLTKEATIHLINEFLTYADKKGISF